ncbi:hypothetical protein AT05_07520 [Schleiferia thermophila str. Yellowstone]|nr:hypothetical protein AT05_07520 [Schleiferia thermophila str. Yellowstone]
MAGSSKYEYIKRFIKVLSLQRLFKQRIKPRLAKIHVQRSFKIDWSDVDRLFIWLLTGMSEVTFRTGFW